MEETKHGDDVYNPSTWEAEAEDLFEASLRCITNRQIQINKIPLILKNKVKPAK